MITLHPQLQQLINLFLLLIIGKYVAHIYLTWEAIVGILIFTFLVEHLFYFIKNRVIHFISFSSLSTAIGVVLMMVTTQYYIYLFVVFFALLQKQFLHYKKQHFFNPSNFALILALLLFYDDAHIVLGQLGDDRWMLVIVSIIAMSILFRVKRWVLPLVFVLIYLLLQYLVIVSSDPVMIMEDIYHRFYSVSFMVFIVFMLTDPKTTPKTNRYQALFAVGIALLATSLDYVYGFRVQHLFMALFLSSPWIVLLRQYPKTLEKKPLLLMGLTVFILALSAIIYIQMQDPYYFEMDT